MWERTAGRKALKDGYSTISKCSMGICRRMDKHAPQNCFAFESRRLHSIMNAYYAFSIRLLNAAGVREFFIHFGAIAQFLQGAPSARNHHEDHLDPRCRKDCILECYYRVQTFLFQIIIRPQCRPCATKRNYIITEHFLVIR